MILTVSLSCSGSRMKTNNRHAHRRGVSPLLLLCLLASVIWGCQPAAVPPAATVPDLAPEVFDGEQALAYVRELVAISPRDAGTPGAERAARLIGDTITPFSDTCVIDRFEDLTPKGTQTFYNVIATLQGTGPETVILGSHLDTKSGIGNAFQGANDSGSSTGVLMALARVLHAQPRLPFTVMFAFFDGEECMRRYGPQDGLHGSRRVAGQLEMPGLIRAVIVLDMIGDKDLTVTIPRNTSKALAGLALQAAAAEGVRQRFRLASGAVLDDHVPFFERNIPTLNLIDFDYGSAPGLNDFWHTEQDSLQNISAQSLQITGRVTLRILMALASQRVTVLP